MTPTPDGLLLEAFRKGLRELGYIEGKNLSIEWRSGGARGERLAQMATELVRLKVDVIVAGGTPAIAAAQKATNTIPIVMTSAGDPVGSRFAKSLARPGGNITGLSIIAGDIVAKELELLHAVAPKTTRVAYLVNPANPVFGSVYNSLRSSAKKIGIDVLAVEASSPPELDAAFSSIKKQKLGAVIVAADAFFIINREQIVSMTAKHRLPAIASFGEYAEAGGLMSYAINRPELWRHATLFVDKILRGAKPGDLPIEQPTRIDLTVNVKTAKALGIAIPKSIQLQASRMIE